MMSAQVSRSPQRKVRIYLLGKMRATAPDGTDLLPVGRKTRALLAYLCFAKGAPVPRARLARLLWDRVLDAHARLSLRYALAELHRTVKKAAPEMIEIDRETVRLNLRAVWIDALAVTGRGDQLFEDLQGISTPFDRWATAERERFDDARRTGLEQKLDRLIAAGAAPKLRAAAAARLADFDPAHEPAVRALMTALIHLRDRPRAIRTYERCCRALAAINLSPSRETVALYEAVLIVSPPAPPTPGTLPAPPSGPASAGSDAPAPPFHPPVIGTEGRGHDPVVAVIPFLDLSAQSVELQAGAGLAEDLITGIARAAEIVPVSRLSTFAAGIRDKQPQEIGETLGARYILSGSTRVVDDSLRLAVELTDSRTGTPLWSWGWDRNINDLLDAQKLLADEILQSVVPRIHAAELDRARLKGTEDREARDFFLCARASMHNFSRVVFDQAEALFDQALERDPSYPAALAWRGYYHALRIGQGWSSDAPSDINQADYFTRRAVECGALNPMALAVKGHIAAYLHKDFETAFTHLDTALQIDPTLAPAWLWRAAAHAYVGDGGEAVEEIERAMSLAPYDPLMYAYTSIASLAYLADGQVDRCVEYALRSVQQNRTYTTAQKLLVLGLQLSGRRSEARFHAQKLLMLEPHLTVEQFRERTPASASELGETYCTALASAGIPLFG
jgi:DNA-binding SARP family transcriptional activator/TolB-like protein